MSDKQDRIIYLERLLEARLPEEEFDIFLNKHQLNVDIKGTPYRFYTQVAASSNYARLFFYKLGVEAGEEQYLRDIVAMLDKKFHLWKNIDDQKTKFNQVAFTGIMMENVPQVIKKISEIAVKFNHKEVV